MGSENSFRLLSVRNLHTKRPTKNKRETLTELFPTRISCGVVEEGTQDTEATEEGVLGIVSS
jgi:hypothetical protein